MAKKKSSQKFIARNRAPRVQIEYDLELYGAEKKINLPFVMGVMADLSGKPAESLPAVADRKFLEIDVDNFDERLKAMKNGGWAMTLGAGATLVAPFVRSNDVHVYVTGPMDLMTEVLDLTPVEFGGNVHLSSPDDEGVMFGARDVEGVCRRRCTSTKVARTG